MSYTLTCPDPECKTTFELDDADFDALYENEEPIMCPGTCGLDYEWDYDPAKPDGQEITLTVACEDDEGDEEEDDSGMALVETEDEEEDEEE